MVVICFVIFLLLQGLIHYPKELGPHPGGNGKKICGFRKMFFLMHGG